jgi:hypothetical protein
MGKLKPIKIYFPTMNNKAVTSNGYGDRKPYMPTA